MKKSLLIFFMLFISHRFLCAQTNTFPSNGNVGIGTSTPGFSLEVLGKIRASLSGATSGQFEATNATNGNIYFQTAISSGNGIINLNNVAGANTVVLHTNGASYLNGGNIGIGTTSPSTLLSINKATSSTSYGGYPAIEVNNPNISGDASSAIIMRSGTVSGAGVSGAIGGLYSKAIDNGSQYLWLRTFSPAYPLYIGSSQSDMAIVNNNVLIGKTSQTNTSYRLDVNGSIRANKVVVNTTGADFVFDPSYKLMPLEAVNLYVQKHNHLPGIQSASQMQKNGVEVGEYQTKLLQKIEELTLYIIDLKKDNDALKKDIDELKKRLQ